MKANPFTVTGAPGWPLQPLQRSEDVTGAADQLQEQEVQQLARLLGRVLEVAESDPGLYEELPWLRNVSLWELLLKRKKEAHFPYVSPFPNSSRFSHSSDLPKVPKTAVPDTAATLLAFFDKVRQPMAEMVEALYLSPLLRDTRTVYDILHGMAGAAGVKPLPKDVVVAMCANLTRSRFNVLKGCWARPHPAIWNITWRRIPIRLQWTMPQPMPQLMPQPMQGDTEAAGDSLLVMVREEITHMAGIGYQQTGKMLAFRCLPDPLDRQGVGDTSDTSDTSETTECIGSAMKLALYDALVFPRSRDGQFNRCLCPPTLLCVQPPLPGAPVPKGIREAAQAWGIQVEEAEAERELTRQSESESEWVWKEWDKELEGRVLDPVHYMRILDRGFERTYGYAPFLTKQRATHYQGWHWRMRPDNDPLLSCYGLRELLSSYPAVVGDDGTVEWQGLHYRDFDEDVLRYFPGAPVMLHPSPLAEAAILVYRLGSVLCYAVAEELHHEDGSYRPYWFPYPRLGE